LIITEPFAYRLTISPDDVDFLVIDSAVKQGMAAYSTRNWPQCLALLTEPAAIRADDLLADVRSPYLHAEYVEPFKTRAPLVLARQIEAFIRASFPRASGNVLYQLEGLISDSPGDEHLRWMYMLAQYRAGRPSQALHAYTGTRNYLIAETGVEPGAELQDLQKFILANDSRLLETPFLD
jgi:DNA-binding SARP family transcriptional activator